MSTIVLDAGKVNSYVLPSLSKSENTMYQAYSTSQLLRNSLPNSFNGRGIINEITNQIYNLKKEINNIDTLIEKKIERAKAIESKGESRIGSIVSKIGSIVGTIGGATLGSATGGVVGAVAGAVVGNQVGKTVGKTIYDTGAKIVSGFVSGVKKIGSAIGNGIKNVGSKIAKGAKSLCSKFVSGVKKVAKGITTIGKAVINTGAKVVKSVTSFCKNIWEGTKSLGSKIWNGCKKIVKSVASFIEQKALPWIKNAASTVWSWIKSAGIFLGKTLATIGNLVVSLVEGIVSFVEAIGDFVLLVAGGVCSIFTAIPDLIVGCVTGDWSWSATKAVWTKWIMPWVGYDWTSKAFDGVYSWAPFKALNNASWGWAQRGNLGYKIGKGIGYVAGVVILTIVTFGAGSAPTALTSSVSAATNLSANAVVQIGSGVVAGTAAVSKNAQSGYNELSEEEKQSGAAIAKVLGNSAVQGTIEGATFAVTYGKGLKTLGSADDVVIEAGKTYFGSHKGMEVITKAGIQATKAYVSDGAECLIMDKEFNFAETTQDAFVNAAVSAIYDTKVSGPLKSFVGKLDKFKPNCSTASSAEGAFTDAVTTSTRTKIVTAAANTAIDTMENSKVYGKVAKDVMKEGMNYTIDTIEEVIQN